MVHLFNITRRACVSYILVARLSGTIACLSLVETLALEPIPIGKVTSLTGPFAEVVPTTGGKVTGG
jgi:hypothetical protein